MDLFQAVHHGIQISWWLGTSWNPPESSFGSFDFDNIWHTFCIYIPFFWLLKKTKKGLFSTTMSSFPTSAIQTFAAWPLRKCPLTLEMATGNPARKPVEVGSLSHCLTTRFISIPGAWPCDFWIINSTSRETDDVLEKCEVLFLPGFLNVKDLSNLLVSLIWDFRFSSDCKLYIAGAILCHLR